MLVAVKFEGPAMSILRMHKCGPAGEHEFASNLSVTLLVYKVRVEIIMCL